MKVGFIGTGNMGPPMLANLVKKGFAVVAYDLVPAAVAAAVKAGATGRVRGRGGAGGATSSSPCFRPRPTSRPPTSARAGSSRARRPAGSASTCPRSTPPASRRVAAALRAAAVRFLDAPVSGGVPRAEDGTLAIMVGGEARDLEEARPVLAAMGANIIHVGRRRQRRGRQALQQPDRRRGGGGGERGVPHRRGLRRGPQGPHGRDLEVVRQHVGDGEHASGAGLVPAPARTATTRRVHDRPDGQGPRARRERGARAPGAR